jgi:hypothetical protein
MRGLWLLGVFAYCSAVASADTEYYRHVIFDNSLTPDAYFYSSAIANGHSFVEQSNSRLPVETKTFITPPNALRLQWRSEKDGGWEAEVRIMNFRNRPPEFSGRSLFFWCFAPQAIAAADLPSILLSTSREGLQVAEFPASFTDPLPMGKIVGDLPAGRWVRVRIPLSEFHTASIYEFRPQYMQNVIFHQGRGDGVQHTLILDEFRVDDDPGVTAKLPPPQNVHAVGYERHVEVRWNPINDPALARCVIYRSLDSKNFEPIGVQIPGNHRYIDFLGKPGITATYKVAASDKQYRQSPFSNAVGASTREFTDAELLTMLQEACFHYYWEGADPSSGMARENIPGDDRIVATGASGFGIAALVVGVDRGFVTRAAGLDRLAKIIGFLEHAQRYHGAWSHYMNGSTGQTMPLFGMFDNGGEMRGHVLKAIFDGPQENVAQQ